MENNMQFVRKSFEEICAHSTGALESITNVFYCKVHSFNSGKASIQIQLKALSELSE